MIRSEVALEAGLKMPVSFVYQLQYPTNQHVNKDTTGITLQVDTSTWVWPVSLTTLGVGGLAANGPQIVTRRLWKVKIVLCDVWPCRQGERSSTRDWLFIPLLEGLHLALKLYQVCLGVLDNKGAIGDPNRSLIRMYIAVVKFPFT